MKNPWIWKTQHKSILTCLVSRKLRVTWSDHLRDKDAIQAVLCLLLKCGLLPLTVWSPDGIEEIYKQYGYCKNHLLPFQVWTGCWNKKIMDKFRNVPKQFNNTDIAKTDDFLEQIATFTADGVENWQLLQATFLNTSWLMIHGLAVRPSGYRTKIKFYIATVGESEADAKEKLQYRSRINAL